MTAGAAVPAAACTVCVANADSGDISVLRVAAHSGTLTRIGAALLPAAIATDRSGRFLFSASYGEAVVAVSPIDADGVVGAAQQVQPTPPKAHAIHADPSNRFVFATSLGGGVLLQWRFDAVSGVLTRNAPAQARAREGARPRHFVFGVRLNGDKRFVYVLNELDAMIDVFALDADRGTLKPVQSIACLTSDFSGEPWAADIHLTPDSRFLYTSERRSSTLAAFRVDADTGRLPFVQRVDTEAQPRGFAGAPDGRCLFAVGQLSHRLSRYAIDAASRALTRIDGCAVGRNPNWVEAIALPWRWASTTAGQLQERHPMNSIRRRTLQALCALSALSALAALGMAPMPAFAQDVWPAGPVRIIVPFAAGGTSDALARLLGQRLQDVLKQTVIVENKAGAGGVIGADAAAKSPPDGYTLLLGTIASHAINPALQPKMPYDATRDFAPVFLIGNIANVLLVGAQQPMKTVKEPIAAVKAKPGTLAFGTPGAGSSQHPGRHPVGHRQAAQRRAEEDRRADRGRGAPVRDGGREPADDAGAVWRLPARRDGQVGKDREGRQLPALTGTASLRGGAPPSVATQPPSSWVHIARCTPARGFNAAERA